MVDNGGGEAKSVCTMGDDDAAVSLQCDRVTFIDRGVEYRLIVSPFNFIMRADVIKRSHPAPVFIRSG